MDGSDLSRCGQCGGPVVGGELACGGCHALVHQRELEELAGEALRLEGMNPFGAAMVWRRALALLPVDSIPYRQLTERIGALVGGWGGSVGGGEREDWRGNDRGLELRYGGRPQDDPLGLALAKTAGSMLFAAVVYYFFLFHDVTIAAGFVLLMLVHEMGHVIAMRWRGLSASPPIFVPFLGALINMRESPRNALEESIVGIGGPLLGTIGALACYAMALHVPNYIVREELMVVAQLAFMLNLFNLLPVPPLDGGRITAAISPWLWIPGLLGLGWLMVEEVRGMFAEEGRRSGVFGIFILVMVFVYAFPRIRETLQLKGREDPYYKVSRAASWVMGVLYFGLGGVLVYMFEFRLGGFGMFR